ncbi:MAG: N-6 adenine-specific DNA methylase, partial [Paracoccaceae bacterium]
IVVGNTLSLEVREIWHTPAHHMGLWSSRLKSEPRLTSKTHQNPVPVAAPSAPAPKSAERAGQAATPPKQATQLSFDL